VIDTVHICIAMKPTEGSFAQNAIEHGVAGLNVDATRVGSEKRENQQKDTAAWSGNAWGANPQHDSGEAKEVEGRWPANVLLDGSEDVQSRFPFTESHPGKVRYDNRNSMFGFGGGGCAGDAGSA
jgi:site-specific DNA-methyltransferase (adenine-specific)